MPEDKTCFVIAPIGEDGSPTRDRSDQILEYVIKPVTQLCGYDARRADEISEPGMITAQIIQHIVEDPMVVADLTDWNANVFYELALRHALRKPTVHLIQAGQKIPFDVAGARTIQVDHTSLPSVEACKAELEKQIRAVTADPSLVDNPISVSVELQALRQSDNPLEKSNAEILSTIQEVRSLIIDQKDENRQSISPEAISDGVKAVRQTQEIVNHLKSINTDASLKVWLDLLDGEVSGQLWPVLDYIARQSSVPIRRRRPGRKPIDLRDSIGFLEPAAIQLPPEPEAAE